jgi:predicted TPR repeat methyltransferase
MAAANKSRVSSALGAARALGSVDEVRSLYRDWAVDYDRDVFESAGVIGTDTITRLLAEHVADRTVPILDIGCGTGAAGSALRLLGFVTIDGVDISPEMLGVAEAKGAYRHLVEADLNETFELPAAPYGASICAGTFVHGHVGPVAIAAIVANLTDSAIVAWVIAADQWPKFEPVLTSGSFEILHQSLEPVRRDGPAEAVMFVARII